MNNYWLVLKNNKNGKIEQYYRCQGENSTLTLSEVNQLKDLFNSALAFSNKRWSVINLGQDWVGRIRANLSTVLTRNKLSLF